MRALVFLGLFSMLFISCLRGNVCRSDVDCFDQLVCQRGLCVVDTSLLEEPEQADASTKPETSVKPEWPNKPEALEKPKAVRAGGASDESASAVAVDSLGNIYVIGQFEDKATFGTITLTSSGHSDIFVAKLDNNGNWIWAVKAGGRQPELGNAIALDGSGNVYVAGHFAGTATFGATTLTGSGGELFVGKLDSSGSWQWAIRAVGFAHQSEFSQGIALDGSGNLYVTGRFFSRVTFGTIPTFVSTGASDVFVAKVSPVGKWLWAVQGGGTSGDYSFAIAADTSGNTFIAGMFRINAKFGKTTLKGVDVSRDVFVAKVSAAGKWLWATKAGGAGTEYGYGIAVDKAGNSLVTGQFAGTASFGSITLTSVSGTDIFVGKVGTSGVWQWVTQAGGAAADVGHGIAVDPAGNSYVTGEFADKATFGSLTLTSAGETDIFVGKVTSNGEWSFAKRLGGAGDDRGLGLTINSFGNIFVVGQFADTATFGASILTSSGGSDVFVVRTSEP